MKGTHNPSVPPTAEASAITRVADFDVSLMSWLVRVGWTLLIVAKSTWQVDSIIVSVILSILSGSSMSNIPVHIICS